MPKIIQVIAPVLGDTVWLTVLDDEGNLYEQMKTGWRSVENPFQEMERVRQERRANEERESGIDIPF